MGAHTVLLFILLTGTASAQVYRWTDADGKVHYGDKPPAGKPATTLTAPNMPGSATQAVPGERSITVPLPQPTARDLEIKRRQEEYARKADDEEKAREIEAFRNSPQRATVCAGYEDFLRNAEAGKFRDQPAADLKQAVDATRKYRDQLCR